MKKFNYNNLFLDNFSKYIKTIFYYWTNHRDIINNIYNVYRTFYILILLGSIGKMLILCNEILGKEKIKVIH